MSTVQGYSLEFDVYPVQYSLPKEINFNTEEMSIIDSEVEDLLKKGAIAPSVEESDQFISNIFVVKKPNGKYRPIINLKELNNFVHYEHFKQEHFKVILDLVQENDYFCSVDLQDAYFSIPIHSEFQKFLKFYWRDSLYAFVCLPFGYSAAPRVFTKLLKPIYAWFRSQAIRCAYYIDDSLNMNCDRDLCLENAKIICDTLQSLGYVINEKKSSLVPSHKIVFFGYLLDSVLFMVFLTEEKIEKILSKANNLIHSELVIVRELASFIGSVINAFHAVLEAPLHYRQMERCKINGLGKNMNFDNKVFLSEGAKSEIRWWLENIRLKNGKRIRPQNISFTCQTDASKLGWACVDVSSGSVANGRWLICEQSFAINYLELLAVFNGIKALYDSFKSCHLQVFSDNVTAVAYINDMGGMSSPSLDSLAIDIWNWCLERSIFLSANYLKGSENVQADYFSRHFRSESAEWMLKKEIFDRICSQMFFPDIDLFASRLNCQLSRFVSWFPQPGAFRNDAFSFPWSNLKPYLFPPFSLVGRVINKLKDDKVKKAILIIPLWRTQFWFPLIMDLLISDPVRLPRHKDLMIMPQDSSTVCPMVHSTTFVALQLSADISRVEDYFQKLLPSSLVPGNKELVNSIPWHGKDGCFGVHRNVRIPLKQLKWR